MKELKRRPLGDRNVQVDGCHPRRPKDHGPREKENNREGEAAGKLDGAGKGGEGKLEGPPKERSYHVSDFTLGPLIGSGKYGRVYYARDHLHDRDVALKRLDICTDRTERSKQFEREIEIQGHLEHLNIIRLYGTFREAVHLSSIDGKLMECVIQDKLFLVLEFAKEGSLFDLLQKTGRMNEQTVVHILRSIIKALMHLHSHGVVHRDIKPENILIDQNGTPKLTDFGWSVISKARRYTTCGTMDYVAPEMLTNEGYDDGVDIWSLGVLCYELLIGDPPFADKDTLRTSDRIRNLDYTFPVQPTISETAKDFIKAILVSDPRQRMGIEGMLRHEFLRRR